MTPAGLSLEGDVGEVTTSTGPDAPLRVDTLATDPAGKLQRRSWSAPFRIEADGVTALLPAQTFTNGDVATTRDLETCAPDPALRVRIEGPRT